MMVNKKTATSASVAVIAAIAVVVVLLTANFLISSPTSNAASSSESQTSSGSLSSSTGSTSTQSSSASSSSTLFSTTSTSLLSTSSSTSETLDTSSSASSQTMTSSQSSASCSTMTPALIQTAFSNDSSTPDVVSLFSSYSKMGVSWSEVSTGTIYVSQTFTQYDTSVQGTASVAESYNVVYASSTTYKVDILENQSGNTLSATAWFLKNGTLVSYDFLGQNTTGSEASALVQGLMSPFFYQGEYTSLVQTITSQAAVRAVSAGDVKVGSTTVALTNYTSTSVPFTVSICGGTLTLSAFSLQTGTVQGANVQLLMTMSLSGSETYHSQTNQIVSLSVNLTSLQSA